MNVQPIDPILIISQLIERGDIRSASFGLKYNGQPSALKLFFTNHDAAQTLELLGIECRRVGLTGVNMLRHADFTHYPNSVSPKIEDILEKGGAKDLLDEVQPMPERKKSIFRR